MKIKGNIVDILDRQTFGAEISMENGFIVHVRPTGCKESSYFLPGFIDAHVHIESSMATPCAFAQTAVKHGTIAVVADPHEIANVLGIEGIDFMLEDAMHLPFYCWLGLPSCVPSTDLEQADTSISAAQTEFLLKHRKDIHFLAEMMNFPGVISGDTEVMLKIQAAIDAGKPVDGHAPLLMGESLKKYVNAGITTDHEASHIEEGREKCSLGMKIIIREGTATKDFHALHPLLKEYPSQVMFATDDSHPSDLLQGHINVLVRRAISLGYDLYDVLRAASYNPAQHYKIPVGFLQKGDSADFIQVDDLENMHIQTTYIKGQCVYDGRNVWGFPLPKENKPCINRFCAFPLSPADVAIKAESSHIRVITCRSGEVITGEEIHKASLCNGFVQTDTERDIVKLVVINRYRTVPPAVAFIRGTGIKRGAIAQSIMHDNHNLIAAGVDDAIIVKALNRVITAKGGIAVALPQGNTVFLPLPVAGLMSPLSVEEIAEQYDHLREGVKAMGTFNESLQMTLAFMGLIVIPKLKLSDKGLFDTDTFTFTRLFV